MQLNPGEMESVVRRLKRAQGQLGGIIKMIEEGRDCDDIVTQLAAVSKAVDRAGFSTIAVGLKQCLEHPDQGMDQAKMEKLFLSLA
ncbi:metal-sensitive transcriptional regulator [Tessaracoccus sp. ZS01]|uniref:metal-sensitive transcriptional regulator n=1 Tax=Tessaracoccus sp. ZS01 TaxID=1906324 RepID=UPI00096DF6FE|nr:metal-sensitive transcriptional regulator [Tessaracoccus sp. ZS01]MCG6567641.1 transcriptional regulator [Tessaracoccus sp. ZS01]OMG55715.1 cytoplasmic protein [Tessaracoccus sp. ZS01]